MKVAIRYDPIHRGMAVWLYEERENGTFVVEPTELVITKATEGEEWSPTFRFNSSQGHEFLQSLSNALAEVGYEPNIVKESISEMAAVRYHLEDMRKLVKGLGR